MHARISGYAFAIATAALFLGWVRESPAAPITQPTGLNPGDQYRLAFVTSTTRDATSTNIDDYNAFVTNVANTVPELVALGTTWTAIASTSAVAARDNTSTNPGVNGTGVPIYLLSDTKLADNNTDLWDGTIDWPFGVTESSQTIAESYVWTGSHEDGSPFINYTLGFPSNIFVGDTESTDRGWMTYAAFVSPLFPPPVQLVLYSMSGILTAIPEPSTATLLALGLTALGLARRRF